MSSMDSLEHSNDNWQYLSAAWLCTQADWRGITANQFSVLFWQQFERDVQDYLKALADLTEEINEARTTMYDR